jgi:hypothetical protein
VKLYQVIGERRPVAILGSMSLPDAGSPPPLKIGGEAHPGVLKYRYYKETR